MCRTESCATDSFGGAMCKKLDCTMAAAIGGKGARFVITVVSGVRAGVAERDRVVGKSLFQTAIVQNHPAVTALEVERPRALVDFFLRVGRGSEGFSHNATRRVHGITVVERPAVGGIRQSCGSSPQQQERQQSYQNGSSHDHRPRSKKQNRAATVCLCELWIILSHRFHVPRSTSIVDLLSPSRMHAPCR